MNTTKTMRLPPRRMLPHTPTGGASSRTTSVNNNNNSSKRKERESDRHAPPKSNNKFPKPAARISSPPPPPPPPFTTTTAAVKVNRGGSKSTPCNKLLAGYLAHEFITSRTLFGEAFDPARSVTTAAVTTAVSAAPVTVSESKKPKPIKPAAAAARSASVVTDASAAANKLTEKEKIRYVEVNDLLKRGGAHFTGIVNPTQLARVLQM